MPTPDCRAGSKPTRRRKSSDLAPDIAEELSKAAPAARAAKYRERLTTAADALDRGRYDDARRMVQPVLRDLPEMAFGHEIAGLAFYRTGQWRKAAAELEVARQLDRTLNHHAVLADCYRALKRYDMVDQLWLELREGSPEPALMAEGRIVAAGALADQGNLKGALKLMERGADVPKKVRDHHLRQWYVLGDLHDRSGDIIKARRLFGMIAEVDPQFADVADRLRGLGRVRPGSVGSINSVTPRWYGSSARLPPNNSSMAPAAARRRSSIMNVVFLQGRLSSDPVLRELSSGSRLLSLEVTTSTDDGTANVPVAWFDPPTIPDWGAGVDVVGARCRQAPLLPRPCRHPGRTEVVADRGVRGHQATPGAAAARARRHRARCSVSGSHRSVGSPAGYDQSAARHVVVPTRDGS